MAMPIEYLKLASKRANSKPVPYKQPEDYGYDFSDWVSPYTKGAHALNSITLVLQDWASDEKLAQGFNPCLQEHGRILNLTTNRRLEEILKAVFGLEIEETYITNVFLFIKSGGMSNTIPAQHCLNCAQQYLRPELNIIKPKLIIALGTLAHNALSKLDIQHVSAPHPAARIGKTSTHISEWESELNKIS